MKRFKEMIREYYMDDPRSPEERNADAHLFDLIETDGKHRVESGDVNTLPLEYDTDALIALRNHYLGSRHPQLHPEKAKELKTYMQTITERYPHLKPHM